MQEVTFSQSSLKSQEMKNVTNTSNKIEEETKDQAEDEVHITKD